MPGRLQEVGGRTAPGASSRAIAEDVRYVTGAWMRRSDHVQIGDEKSV